MDGGQLLHAGVVSGGGDARPRVHGGRVHLRAGDGGGRGAHAFLRRARQLRALSRGGFHMMSAPHACPAKHADTTAPFVL